MLEVWSTMHTCGIPLVKVPFGRFWKRRSKNQKNNCPYFGELNLQKYPYIAKILKKSLQGSIHAQFYMAIKGSFG